MTFLCHCLLHCHGAHHWLVFSAFRCVSTVLSDCFLCLSFRTLTATVLVVWGRSLGQRPGGDAGGGEARRVSVRRDRPEPRLPAGFYWPFHCLSMTFHCHFNCPFLDLPRAFHCLSLPRRSLRLWGTTARSSSTTRTARWCLSLAVRWLQTLPSLGLSWALHCLSLPLLDLPLPFLDLSTAFS